MKPNKLMNKKSTRKEAPLVLPVDCPFCKERAQIWHRQDSTFGCGCINSKCTKIAPSIGEDRDSAVAGWNDVCEKIRAGKFIS